MALFKSKQTELRLTQKFRTSKYKYKKANQYGTYWSDEAPPSNIKELVKLILQKANYLIKIMKQIW